MKILKDISINNIEEYFQKIADNSNILELSREYSNKNFFDVTTQLQLISTFIRANDKYILKLPINKIAVDDMNSEEFHNELEVLREEVNYVATIMSWGKRMINLESEDLERSYINKFTPIIKTEMNTPNDISQRTQKGNVLFLTCFDHFAGSKGLLDSFYLDKTKFYDQKEFFFSPFNGRLSNFSKSFNKNVAIDNLKSTFNDITEIIYELMLNTHEWARSDEHFKELSPNIRGVYVKLHKGKIDNLKKKYSNAKALETYLKHDFSEDSQGLTTFFEISVFDSGPGFVKRNYQDYKNMTIKDEVDIVKKCLTLHQTSASGYQQMVKGAGLDRISRILSSKGGFFKIRTARASVYRDYVLNPYKEVSNYDEIRLSDWNNSSDNHFTEYSEVAGATINILYPFKY